VLLLMLPLPGALSTGAHGFDTHAGSAKSQLPDGKHTTALL
jgi:hypothetical protein